MAHLSNDRIIRFYYHSNAWTSRAHSLYFQSGRESFLALLRSFKKLKSKIVLLPSYIPEGLFAPAIAAGWQVKLYPINSNFSPKWGSLAELLDLYKPEVAVLIHHFGVPQDATRFAELCRSSGTVSVEDQAHLVALPESDLGTLSDVVMVSLPKIFGIPDGASLSIAHSIAKNLSPRFDTQNSNLVYVVSQTGALLMSTFASMLPASLSAFVNKASNRLFRPYSILMKNVTRVRPMSRLSPFLMAHSDRREEAKRRIELANLYAPYLNRKVFKHVLPSPPPYNT